MPEYKDMIKVAYDKGHTIGLHTYSHTYSKVYASVDAYFEDLDQIGQMVKDEIVVAGSQNDMVEQIGHSNEIAYSQNKPYTYNSKQHPAQFIQVIPKSQFFNFCHY